MRACFLSVEIKNHDSAIQSQRCVTSKNTFTIVFRFFILFCTILLWMQHVHFIGQRDLVQTNLELRKCLTLFSLWKYVKLKMYFNSNYNKQQNKKYLEGDFHNLQMLNDRFKTTSRHFLPTTWISFHKIEFQTVILKCWIWFGSKVMTKWKTYKIAKKCIQKYLRFVS